jgi:hypothetical protein
MWEDSEEYIIQHPDGRQEMVRKVFEFPRKAWYDPETRQYEATSGTSDLEWCTRVMEQGYFTKAGWPEYEGEKWPFVVDTRLFCQHIDMDGAQYP